MTKQPTMKSKMRQLSLFTDERSLFEKLCDQGDLMTDFEAVKRNGGAPGVDNERMGFVQKQVGHTTTKMIVEHYYNQIPAPDDDNGLEKAFADTIAVDDLIPEATE